MWFHGLTGTHTDFGWNIDSVCVRRGSKKMSRTPTDPENSESAPLSRNWFEIELLVSVLVLVRFVFFDWLVEQIFSHLFHLRKMRLERFNALVKEALHVSSWWCQTAVMEILKLCQVERLERLECVVSSELCGDFRLVRHY